MSVPMIILTAGQADVVRGETEPGHALDPRQMAAGGFALPVAVLSDPAHEVHHDFLTGLPEMDSDDIVWMSGSE